MQNDQNSASPLSGIIRAPGEVAVFCSGDRVRVLRRSPIGHYRVPIYLRGKTGTVERVIEPTLLDNEEEGYGRNAGGRRHYYRVGFLMSDIWQVYTGEPTDRLYVELFESWLEGI